MNSFKTEPLPDYGEHMLIEEFEKACQAQGYIDYDGYGNYATATEMSSSFVVHPSDITRKNYVRKLHWTHVCWFNK